MKLFTALALMAFLTGSMAMAADSGAQENQKVETSKNPITGTETTTTTYENKAKNIDGESHKVTAKKKVKHKKNGEVEKSVKVEGNESQK